MTVRSSALLLMTVSCGPPLDTNEDTSILDTGTAVEAIDASQGDTESAFAAAAPGKLLLASRWSVGPQGITDSIQFAVPKDAEWLGIRVGPAPWEDGLYCFQLEELQDDAGNRYVAKADTREEWGAVCHDCSQRVSVQEGYGWFVFPNHGDSLPFVGTVSFRVSLRDCVTLLPVSEALDDAIPDAVLVEVVFGAAPPRDVETVLPLLIARTSDSLLNDRSVDWFRQVLAECEAALAPASIKLVLRDILSITEISGEVTFNTGDRSALHTIHGAWHAHTRVLGIADAAAHVPVVFVHCLRELDSLTAEATSLPAETVRIPGGGQTGLHADGIFVATALCEGGTAPPLWTSTKSLGKILAHELGHYLGLYHTVEADSSADLLADTTEHNLMYYQPVLTTATGLSPLQVEVIRHHPMLSSEVHVDTDP